MTTSPGPGADPPRLSPRGVDHVARLGDRSLFPGLAPLVYANHAGISPASFAVKQALVAWVDDSSRRGADAFPTWLAQRSRLRDKLAALVGARADEIAFEQNTSRGVSDVANCFAWRPGDAVVLFDGEFPANVTPWQLAAARHGLEIRWADARLFATDEAAALEKLDALLDGARLCAVSAVEFQTGYRMPLETLGARCRDRGVRLFVDAVQACGIVPIDVRAANVDFLACGSHKWLMGAEGAGFLFVDERRWGELVPNVAGWLGHEDGLSFLFEGPGQLRYDRPIISRPAFIEGGNLSAPSFAALEASLDLILGIGVKKIFDHVQAFHDLVEPKLVEWGFTSIRSKDVARRSGSLCLVPPTDVPLVELHRALGRYGIACAMPDGYLRFSPHWPNDLGEAEQVIASTEAALTVVRTGEEPKEEAW